MTITITMITITITITITTMYTASIAITIIDRQLSKVCCGRARHPHAAPARRLR
jgi:hypothetical protein